MRAMKKAMVFVIVCYFIGISFPQTGLIKQVQADLGDVILSFDSPGPIPEGLTYDGNYLWNSDDGSNKIYKLDPLNGNIIDTINSPGIYPTGICIVENMIWNSDALDDKIYQIYASNGSIKNSFNSPGIVPKGLTWDGSALWHCDASDEKIYQLNPSNGNILKSYNSPANNPQGIAWDGTYLWVAELEMDKIYKIDPSNGNILNEFDSPGLNPRGLAWDGSHLWNADNGDVKIYKIDVGGGGENQLPVADAGGPYETNIGELIQFDSSGSYDPDGQILGYMWDFNEGNTSDIPNPTHSFTQSGEYLVSLTVSDDLGATDTDTTMVTISDPNQLPIANFSWKPVQLYANDTIIFNASISVDPDGTIEFYYWDFNDGTTEKGMIVNHTYYSPADYSVNLTVTDNDGKKNSIIKMVSVRPERKPQIHIDSVSGGFGINVVVSNIGTDVASQIPWSVSCDSGFLGLLFSANQTYGVIDELSVNESQTIRVTDFQGIGPMNILVQVDDSVASASGFLLGPLMLRVLEH